MHALARSVLLRAATIGACAVAAAFVARIAVRTPALWPLVPEPFLRLLAEVIQPSGQEAVADVEWFGFWLVSFVALLLSVGVGGWLWRRARAGR